MDETYAQFLARKAPRVRSQGIEPQPMPAHLFDFQAHCTEFALRQGRAGLFLATGLGKSACTLEWCRQAAEATNGRALILTPLAVARQFEREGARWGYDARVVREQADAREGISICNYDRLHKLDAEAFGAVALDESSCIKAHGGAMTQTILRAFAGHRFRLSATATPAPNDHMELGQQVEFLGLMRSVEMLSRWFINDTSTASQQWRLKGHAQRDFWDFVASWARMADTPADLGFDSSRFVLPPMQVFRHTAFGSAKAPAGSLFIEDLSATNIHHIKRQTARARAEAIAELVDAEPSEAWLIWADTDYEADALTDSVTGAHEVRGSHPIERKEETIAAFLSGEVRYLVTKPSVAGWGLNLQHCARMAFVGRTFSFEQWHQAVRRCWRFGQTRPVHVHLIVAEGEDQIGRVIDRKAEDHMRMMRDMADAMQRNSAQSVSVNVRYQPTETGEWPAWLTSSAA